MLRDLLDRVRRFNADVQRSREEFKALGAEDRNQPPNKEPGKVAPPGTTPRPR